MKNNVRTGVLTLLGLAILFCFSSCKNNEQPKQEAKVVATIDLAKLTGTETALMLAYLNELGDYVNSRKFPSLIKASSVYENLGPKQLIIDIRSSKDFIAGHISDAVNLEFEAIPEYFESEIVPFEYDKLIIVSEGGQTASYATCLLRLLGYGNVYSMRWGMSGWNKDLSDQGWSKAIGSDYVDMLETTDNEKASPVMLPELKTGKTTGEEILLAKAHQLFSEGLEPAHIKAPEVFESYADFYIMNYIRKDKYESGHIPGAIRYKPQATLGIVSEMSTIPSDKISIVYCGTGHNSGFVTAYLRLFGYNAKTLMYGNNSFMYDKMVAEQETLSWLPFTDKEIGNYPYSK